MISPTFPRGYLWADGTQHRRMISVGSRRQSSRHPERSEPANEVEGSSVAFTNQVRRSLHSARRLASVGMKSWLAAMLRPRSRAIAPGQPTPSPERRDTRDREATVGAVVSVGNGLAAPAEKASRPPYRQLLLPEDEVREIGTNWPIDGFPVTWVQVSECWLLNLEINPATFAEQLGISFEQRVDLGNGLGDRPTAVLELVSGLRLTLMLNPTSGPISQLGDVFFNVDPSTINRPFVEGFGSEWIIERYRDDLIDEVVSALGLSVDLVNWRVQPMFDPPMTTPEGIARLQALRDSVADPRFAPNDRVRVFPEHNRLAHVRGMSATVHRKYLRHRYRGPIPHTFGPGEWESLPLEWQYWTEVPEAGRFWALWEDELQPESPTLSDPAPEAVT